MFICINIFLFCLMAFNAPYPLFSMAAMLSLVYLPFPYAFLDMAVNTLFIIGRNIRSYLILASLYLYIADYGEGYEEDEAQCPDKIFHKIEILCLHFTSSSFIKSSHSRESILKK